MKPLVLLNRTCELALYEDEYQVVVDLGLLLYVVKESRLDVWLVHFAVVRKFASMMLFYYQAQNTISAKSYAKYWQTILETTQHRELFTT